MTSTRSPVQQMAPLTDAIITAVARLVDDAKSGTREPSHSDIEFQINRCGLTPGDPKTQGQTVGKVKRVRGVLSWALEHDPEGGEALVSNLTSLIRGCGGFRPTSPNYVGSEAVRNAADVFKAEGYELTEDGELRPRLLENLSSAELTEALQGYVRRAKRGTSDAALVTGTGKDLLEATAIHILEERLGYIPSSSNFPTLLGQTFIELGLTTTQGKLHPSESPQQRLQRAMFEVACAVNNLRNKEGTGHGRPWLPSLKDADAKASVEIMGVIAEWLLSAHKEKP